MSNKKQLSPRAAAIRRASWAGIIGNGLLAALKITVGTIAGSAAVIADGIDSALDIATSLVIVFAASASEQPPDKNHPWGHSRIEVIASKVIALFILFAGIQLFIGTLETLLSGEAKALPGKAALIVTIFAIIGKAGIALYKYRVADKTKSSMLRVAAINMKNDIFLSLGVLLGLGITYLTNLPVIDTIIGITLSLWIIKSGASLSLEAYWELMDSMKGQEDMYHKLFTIVEETPGAYNPHKARIRKLGTLYEIHLDIEVHGSLTITEAHEIARSLKQNIKKKIPDVYDILLHVEPMGNIENEQFGLTPEDFGPKNPAKN